MDKKSYALIAFARSGSTYIRYIISYFLKTYAMQNNHNNDPVFKNWPESIENSNKYHFRKYHIFSDFLENKYLLTNHCNDIKYIILVRDPISNIIANCKYENDYTDEHFKCLSEDYWTNVKNIDKLDKNNKIIFISYYNISSKIKDIHFKEIKKLLNFFELSNDILKDYDYEKIYSISKNEYVRTQSKDFMPKIWFNINNVYNEFLNKIKNIKNEEYKKILYSEINNFIKNKKNL